MLGGITREAVMEAIQNVATVHAKLVNNDD